MKRIKYQDLLSEENLETIKDTIFHQGIILYPTDTLYGLGGNFFSLEAIQKIDRLKNRQDLPYSVVVSSFEMLTELVETVPEVFRVFYQKRLPGKFTFLFKVAKSIPPALVKGSDKIGIRIPNIPNILKLVETLKVPLLSTSVNRSGEPPLNNPEAITGDFSISEAGRGPSLLIDAGPLPPSRGSTILDITQIPVRCIRQGDDFDSLKELGIPIISQP